MARKSIRLSSQHKVAIVTALAHFQSPSEVQDELQKDFGIKLSLRKICYYDATSKNADLAKSWIDLFKRERRRMLKGLADIGTSHLVVRLKKLDRMASRAEGRQNFALAAQILEQIAKEVGGFYTNRQKIEHLGAGGKPLPATEIRVVLVDPKERTREEQSEVDSSLRSPLSAAVQH